jgi:hypothetical protein
MIYQIVTRGKLCQSKKYFKTKKEISTHIQQVIKKTKDYYFDKDQNFTLTRSLVLDGVNIIEINELLMPNWMNVLGSERSTIMAPFVPIHEKFMTKRLVI